jgi:hypothetical protein
MAHCSWTLDGGGAKMPVYIMSDHPYGDSGAIFGLPNIAFDFGPYLGPISKIDILRMVVGHFWARHNPCTTPVTSLQYHNRLKVLAASEMVPTKYVHIGKFDT